MAYVLGSLDMGDPYAVKKQQKPQPQCKQWDAMGPEEKKAWVQYFKGRGPKPSTKGSMKWED